MRACARVSSDPEELTFPLQVHSVFVLFHSFVTIAGADNGWAAETGSDFTAF